MTRVGALTGVLDRLAGSPTDEDAWRSLYGQLWPFVIAVIYRQLNGVERNAVEDAAQEVFIRLLRSRPFEKIRDADAFRAYVWRIAVNVAKTHLRKVHKNAYSERGLAEWVGNNLTAEPVDGEQFLVEEAVGVAKKALEPEDSELLRLLLEGRKLAEVAETLGLSYSNAGVRLHRLKKQLRSLSNTHTK